MTNTPSEQIRECLAHVEECARKAAAQTNATLKQDFFDLERRWLEFARSYRSSQHLTDFGDVLARTRWLIDESRLLRAIVRNEEAMLKKLDTELLTNSRAKIVESKRLLVSVDRPTVVTRSNRAHLEVVTKPISPTELPSSEETDHNPTTLTINVFQEEGRFGWTVHRRATKEALGRGVAPTELKARVDAFRAGMTFTERLTGQPRSDDNNNLH